MKKMLSVILCISLILGLAACTQANVNTATANTNTANTVENTANVVENTVQNIAENPEPQTETSEEDIPTLSGLAINFDAATDPNNTQDIVVLAGSWKEMGIQYGEQAKEALSLAMAENLASVIDTRESLEAIYKEIKVHTDLYKEKFPQLIEFMEGMAESTGYTFEQIALAFVNFTRQAPELHDCNHIAAWGDATENGDMLVTFNADSSWGADNYLPAVLMFPNDGNATISAMGLKGTCMNSKGLIIQYSAGQGAGEGDTAVGLPTMAPGIYGCVFTDNAADAAKIMPEVRRGRPSNVLCADSTGDAYIVEITSAHYAVRKAGDFGEENYILANNHYLVDDMKSSLFDGDGYWIDCDYRYDSAEKLVKDNLGKITIDTLRKIESSLEYYDKETGKWVDEWDIPTGCWSLQNKDPEFKTVMRQIMDANTCTYYFSKGGEATNVSIQPQAIGTWWKIVLSDDLWETVASAKSALMMDLYDAARDLEDATDATEKTAYLDTARSCMNEGYNYEILAGLAEGNARYAYYGKALTAYCKGQCYAKLAQNDPYAVD